MIPFFQQLTGINCVMFYAAPIFKSFGMCCDVHIIHVHGEQMAVTVAHTLCTEPHMYNTGWGTQAALYNTIIIGMCSVGV